ncbi:carboxylesterase family protein [Devosia sp. ZW T5_3]|uniref:carboxylesterase family protein n=1 Tax=Devosia sp. ZW T5_3 TaxID=3378085 RepID=UPI0038539FCF
MLGLLTSFDVFANPSYQVPGGEMGPKGNGRMPAPSEDCLYLNVWTPAADNKPRPVMFYNHGGGYMIGSGAATGQDGTNLARLYDVVVVQSNHRLGLLGYLFLGDLAEGDYAANAGMLDIQAALQWTRDNIENFGGDPDNIMVWGESGGGSKTAAIYTMPGAASLFHKASIESAAPLRFPTRDAATARARKTPGSPWPCPRRYRPVARHCSRKAARSARGGWLQGSCPVGQS